MTRSRLLLVELVVHFGVVVYAVSSLAQSAVTQSNAFERLRSDPYQWTGLKDGWLLGRTRDDSDVQWREFRGSMPALAGALAFFVLLSRAVQTVAPARRLAVSILYSVTFIGVLHGVCAAHVLFLLLSNYIVARLVAGTTHGVPLVWAWHCGGLLVARLTDGHPFAAFGWQHLATLEKQHGGMLRWHIVYNMLLLRSLSFALDLHWARTNRTPRCPLPAGTPPSAHLDAKSRVELPLPLQHYRLSTYLAHVLYPPTYISGPTLTFNSFVSQILAPPRITLRQVAAYAGRVVGALVLLEVVTHTLYCNALARFWAPVQLRPGGALAGPGNELRVAAIGFWVLVFMWLKFLVVWRMARAFALADGVEVPENMRRCVCNNYDVQGFWQNWHASYNLWLVRYMYIPLGGSRWRALNVWPVFLFVALWHDLELRLLGWAALCCLFLAPEMVIKQLAKQPLLASLMPTYWGRKLAAAAASINILGLMLANLVGFVLGTEHIGAFAAAVLRQPWFAAGMLGSFFSAAHLMLALRDWEASAAARPQAAAKK